MSQKRRLIAGDSLETASGKVSVPVLPQAYSIPFTGRQDEYHAGPSGNTSPYIVSCLPGVELFYGGIPFAFLTFKCLIVTTRRSQDVDVAKVVCAAKITSLHQGIRPAAQRSLRLC